MRIGVISDTHVPVRARALPGEVFKIFAGVDLILHAGDLVTLDVLDELQAIAPVLAVRGNVDHPEVQERLPAVLRIEVGPSVVIGLVHGHEGKGRTTAERAASNFSNVSVVVFGHSHQPMNEWHDGRLLFNPGSATDPRRAPSATVGILEISEAVTARLVDLRGE